MSSFINRRISVTKLPHGVADLRFSIDSPRTEDITLFDSSMIKLSGWVLHNKKSTGIVIKHNSVETFFKCERVRNDVLTNLGIEADPLCGFLIPITFSGLFDVGFIVNDDVVWAAKIEIKPAEKVQIGKSGYLFLDNDHNKSVAQHIGKELISCESLSSWRDYFSTLNEYIFNSQAKRIFTLAPSKELILSEYYPHQKADITPVEQFLINFHNEDILYPKSELIYAGDSTYSRQDTHWTDFGAGVAANHVLSSIGIKLNEPFPFPFRFIDVAGDLGTKVNKSATQKIMKADFKSAREMKVFDNRINNRGLIQIYQNPNPFTNKNVVVFGDSFSHNMIPYFVKVFARVVFVLSGASVDYEILNHEKPDLVICELTTRFLLQSPESNYSVSNDCKRKILSMSEPDKEKYISNFGDSPESCFYTIKTIAHLYE